MKKKIKNKEKPNPLALLDQSDLLVFGYASKIFRDDAKAISIERGETFIPWMGDSKLKLDRYDGRMLLHSMESFLPSSTSVSELEEYEKAEEELCEQERWRSLYKDDEDEAFREEEEKKRQNGGEIGFSYDDNGAELPAQGPELPPDHGPWTVEDEGEQEYVPDPSLQVPPDLVLPPTIKLYSVILKTAKFLSTQGAQMEILLKAKQANNPAFQFLNPMDPLYSFFKHLVIMIKTKQFVPDAVPETDENVNSLVPQYTHRADAAPVIPTIKYKQSADCSYLALINKIKAVAPPPQAATPPEPIATPEVDAYDSTPPPSSPVHSPSPHSATPPPGTPPHALPSHAVPPPIAPPRILGPPPTILGAPPTVYSAHPPPPGVPYAPPPYLNAPPPSHLQGPPPLIHGAPPPFLAPSPSNQPPPPGEGGEDELPGDTPVLVPPPALQTIIDKMASYVARNGRTFEEVVKAKDRNKFSFLFQGDKHHSYYVHKLQMYTTGTAEAKLTVEPVAFKVKKTEEKEPTLQSASGLPAEASSGSGDEKEDEEKEEPPPSPIKAEPKIYEKEDEKKRLEDQNKLKDKLAAAAREKMIMNAKERAVQLERKRKAAKFLELLAMKKPTVSSVDPVELEEGELPVGSWPPLAPPGPPGLVIPKLAGPIEIRSDSNSSPDSSRRKKRKHDSKHRSRSRERKKRRHRSRSPSSRSSKKKRKKEKKRSKRKHKSRSRSSSRSRSRSRSRAGRRSRVSSESGDDSVEEIAQSLTSGSQTKENTPSTAEEAEPTKVQPALNQMTEDLRAKVRAMLGSTS